MLLLRVMALMNVDRYAWYSGLLVLKAPAWSFTYEVHMAGGGDLDPAPVDIGYAFDMAGRLEVHPSMMAQVSTVGFEAGWAQGDDASTEGELEGNIMPFNPAYNVDHLLFKHVIPTIYGKEASVMNAIYAKAYANMQLADNLGFTPQVLFAWNDETAALSDVKVDTYLGTEIEGTLTWTLHPGVNLDFIGSLVLAGDGLTDLLEQKGATNPEDTIWAYQTRLMVYIDQFMK